MSFVVSTGVLVLFDCWVSWLGALSRAPDPARGRRWKFPLRTGLRAGQAAGLLAIFTISGYTLPLSVILSSGTYLVVTSLVSDRLLPRLALRRRREDAGATGASVSRRRKRPSGLSVVASRAERLRNVPVSHFMVPRKSIVGCDSSASLRDVASLMRGSGLSRVIAYSQSVDRPLGLAHIKDVLPVIFAGSGERTVESLLRPLVLAPSSTMALDLLRDFQRLKRRVAIVRDLQGERTLGLVTTEDILEEMVGEIQDEREAPLSSALESGVALVRADLKVRDLIGGLGLPADGRESDVTVGELVQSLLRTPATQGDIVYFRGLRMMVEEIVDGEIWMVRVDKVER